MFERKSKIECHKIRTRSCASVFFSAIGADFYVIRCVKIYRFMILSGLVAMTDDRNFYSTWRSFQLGDRLLDGFLLF